jgi:hypothetical protein
VRGSAFAAIVVSYLLRRLRGQNFN